MTVRTNSTVAGITFLCYIAAGIGALASAGHAHVVDVLTVVTSLSALVLGVTLYAVTRDEDRDLALLALLCRVAESIPGHKMGPVFFAVGSTIFCWLLLRGRMIPMALAWLGVAASALLVVLLVLQRAGIAGAGTNWASSLTWVVWFPLLIFEVTFGIWLIVKGVATQERRDPA